jgi:hypothetical protein
MHANVREHGLVGSTSPRNVGRAMLPPQDVAQPSVTALGIRYDSRRAPSSSESVAFSRFQYIPSRHQAFLILGNGGSSVRVSDVTVLDELKHVLNLSTGANSSVGAGHIVNALIIPPSSPDDKLCLALLFITPDRDDPWQLLSYSPTDQTIGNRIHLPSSQYETTSLEASEDLIALVCPNLNIIGFILHYLVSSRRHLSVRRLFVSFPPILSTQSLPCLLQHRLPYLLYHPVSLRYPPGLRQPINSAVTLSLRSTSAGQVPTR